jgi:hypothetical protein
VNQAERAEVTGITYLLDEAWKLADIGRNGAVHMD